MLPEVRSQKTPWFSAIETEGTIKWTVPSLAENPALRARAYVRLKMAHPVLELVNPFFPPDHPITATNKVIRHCSKARCDSVYLWVLERDPKYPRPWRLLKYLGFTLPEHAPNPHSRLYLLSPLLRLRSISYSC